jgi:hypothetical protein
VDLVGPDRAGRRAEQLLEERLAVAHASGGPAGDEMQRFGGHVGPFGLHDLREPRGDRRCGNRREIEPLAAREDRDRQLLGLRRAEHELHVGGRLLERLEQGVERLPREHVDFVDDVDLEPAVGGADGHVLPQLPDLVDATVAGGVDLDHVDVVAGRDRPAGVAGVAGLRCRPGGALERLGEDPGRARLAGAAGAAEQVGVADAARLDGAGEAPGHVLLPHQFVEALRPVAAGDDLVGGWFRHGRGSESGAGGSR